MANRTDLMRQVDGIYHEFGHIGFEMNGAALQCVRKPCLAWTPDETSLRPDPDAYFQRHLYMGVFPTAPLPANDHTILPSPWADRQYMDYGALFDALHERKWVLRAHVIEVDNQVAKANLFEVPGGYVVPVTFGGKAKSATVTLRGLPAVVSAEGLHPGETEWQPVKSERAGASFRFETPLRRGCALVRLR